MLVNADNETAVGEMDEKHLFRLKKFNHVYYCPTCKRGFDTTDPTIKCKFCSSDIVELKSDKVKSNTNYRYYCTSCEKNFTMDEKADTCINCGSKFIHRYAWGETKKSDNVRMKMLDFKSFFRKLIDTPAKSRISKVKMPKLKRNKQPSRVPLKHVQLDEENRVTDVIEDVIIERSNFFRPLIRLNPFSRHSEEMPTN